MGGTAQNPANLTGFLCSTAVEGWGKDNPTHLSPEITSKMDVF